MHDVTTLARARTDAGRRSRLRHGGEVLAYNRMRRACLRQWPLVALCVLTGVAIGAATWTFGLIGLREAMQLFAPAGFGTGLAVATFLELSRNTVTSVTSLGRHHDYAVLSAAPNLTHRLLRSLPPDQRSPLGGVVFMPASPFASSFRELQDALGNDRVVAFIAPVAGEGASTAALCAAVSAVQQGRSVILVDCDVRHRTFTLALEHQPEAGVMEACEAPEDWRKFVDEEVETGLHFIPAARPRTAWRTLAGAAGFPHLLDRLREAYDLVVLDCPPALSSADGPFLSRLADRSVVVAAWDNTPISAIRETMRLLRARGRTRTSVFMNRVPPGYRYTRQDVPA